MLQRYNLFPNWQNFFLPVPLFCADSRLMFFEFSKMSFWRGADAKTDVRFLKSCCPLPTSGRVEADGIQGHSGREYQWKTKRGRRGCLLCAEKQPVVFLSFWAVFRIFAQKNHVILMLCFSAHKSISERFFPAILEKVVSLHLEIKAGIVVIVRESIVYAARCGHGVIGSRARLRIWFRKEWGFESPCPHDR